MASDELVLKEEYSSDFLVERNTEDVLYAFEGEPEIAWRDFVIPINRLNVGRYLTLIKSLVDEDSPYFQEYCSLRRYYEKLKRKYNEKTDSNSFSPKR